MRSPRSHLLAVLASPLASLSFVARARAAEFTYKLATNVPAAHPLSAHAIAAAAAVTRSSGGRLEIRVFPDGALGSEVDILSQARQGAVEMVMTGDNNLANISPGYAITSVPFAFRGYKDVWSAADGALGKSLRATLTAQNLYGFDRPWDDGFRQISNRSRPIVHPDDIKGLKIRVPGSPMPVALYKALSAIPTAIPGNEQYSALQTHLVDGVDLPLAALDTFKLYEVENMCAITNHLWTGITLVANLDAWRRLPADLRALCDRTFSAEALKERDAIVRGDVELATKLRAGGMSFTHADGGAFKDVVRKAGLFAQWRSNFGAATWSLLEQSTGPLT